jgi:signal transduction histidine kinase/ActR/RegA family two-component response regulator
MAEIPPSSTPLIDRRPSFWLSLILCGGVVLFMAWLRLVRYPNELFPLATGLPLLLVLWNRDLRFLYGMAIAFTAISAIKLFAVLPASGTALVNTPFAFTILMINIWLVVGVIHALLHAMARRDHAKHLLELTVIELEARNNELEQANHELTVREEEIAHQNEELQCQTEEMEQQAEELRQQAEELERQSLDLQEANCELLRRDAGMQTLLDTGRWLRGDLDEKLVAKGICQASAQVLGEDVDGVAITEERDGVLTLQAQYGFGYALSEPAGASPPFSQSFAALILERSKTAYLADIGTRPDLAFPLPASGIPYRSILATPIWLEGKPTAVLEIYSRKVKEWTAQEFRIAEWLATQASLALQAIRFHHELEVRRKAAEEASQQKTRFLAAVSHDVRTPANAICLSAELIERVAADPAQRDLVPKMARSLRSNARSLVELVSDVLDLTRFDAGRVDLQISDFTLSSMLSSELKIALPMVGNKGIEIECALPQPDVWLRTDRMKLSRVLSNIIGNAVKFTETGGIRILCEHLPQGGIHIHVADTGVGIPNGHLPHIFDEFFQLRNPERDREKGTGLGLAICRRLLDAIGCDVSVKSTTEVGTTFTIHIPAELIIAGREAPEGLAHSDDFAGEQRPPVPLLGLRVLLVEDHEDTRSTLATLLRSDGAIVAEAATGREALTHLAEGPHQVMLLDLNLPDIDGTEVLKSLQTDRPEDLKCVLVVSGDTRAERIAEVRQLGADDLIPKPVSIEGIVEALRLQCPALQKARPIPENV